MDQFVYPLEKLTFTEGQRASILKLSHLLKEKAKEYGNETMFWELDLNCLDHLSLAHLQELNQFKKILLHMEDIHYKTAKSIEYKNIQKLLTIVPEKIDYIQEQCKMLEESVRKRYGEVFANNQYFKELFSYQQFKDYFYHLTSPPLISINLINTYKKNGSIFDIVRKHIVSEKISQESDLCLNNLEFNLEDIKNYPKIYQLLRAEFFSKISEDLLGKEIPFGKTSHTEVIRPSHELATNFDINIHEAVILSFSLGPLGESHLKSQDRVNYFELNFEVKNEQENFNMEMLFPISLNNKTFKIKATVYIAYLRCQLISSQRTQK